MTDNPLTEKDFEPQYAGLIGIDFIKEKVQSAKRLLKSNINRTTWYAGSEIQYMIDACFQIDEIHKR